MRDKSIVVGSDANGLLLKNEVFKHLRSSGYQVEDYGDIATDASMYPDIAYSVAKAVADGLFSVGILICGTGIGMSITANKVPGIRAAVCHDIYSAERSRMSNDCQIMALGQNIVTPDQARTLVDIWLDSEFQEGRSTAKVKRIKEIEEMHYGEGSPVGL